MNKSRFFIAFGPNVRNRKINITPDNVSALKSVDVKGVEVFETPFDAMANAYKENQKPEWFMSLYDIYTDNYVEVTDDLGSHIIATGRKCVFNYKYSTAYGTVKKWMDPNYAGIFK